MKTRNKLEALLQKMTIATGTVVLGALASTTAGAATVDADGLRIVNIDQTADNSSFAFDINGDEINDFEVSAFEGIPAKRGIAEQKDFESSFIEALGSSSQNAAVFNDGVSTGDERSFAARFNEGDAVGPGGSFLVDASANLFDSVNGPFATVGDTGFIGLLLSFLGTDGAVSTHFGWAEVERGSMSVLRVAFQTNADTAAKIPGLADDVAAVPLPASLPLLLAGAGGLLAFRRRSDAKAA